MSSKNHILPIPAEPELKRMIVAGARSTRLSQADVMRQGLRIGVPELVRRLRGPRRPLVEYLDRLAGLPVPARDQVPESRF